MANIHFTNNDINHTTVALGNKFWSKSPSLFLVLDLFLG